MVIALIILSFITLISLILFICLLCESADTTKINIKDVYNAVLYNESLLVDIKKELENKKD